ncbi:MAG: hypothetical protein ACYC2H_10775 [Thermoplasmatota archaeon]
MDRARLSQARRPMVPLAVAATVVQAAPSRRAEVPIVSIAIALAVLGVAFAINSPLLDQLGPDHEWAWRFLGFWGEVAGLAVLLGMLFRQPALAWVGAGSFFGVALMLSGQVWVGHLAALALIGAVVPWQLRRQARRDRANAQGWASA